MPLKIFPFLERGHGFFPFLRVVLGCFSRKGFPFMFTPIPTGEIFPKRGGPPKIFSPYYPPKFPGLGVSLNWTGSKSRFFPPLTKFKNFKPFVTVFSQKTKKFLNNFFKPGGKGKKKAQNFKISLKNLNKYFLKGFREKMLGKKNLTWPPPQPNG